MLPDPASTFKFRLRWPAGLQVSPADLERALHAHDLAGREAAQRVERVVLVGVAAHEEPFDDVADGARARPEVPEEARLQRICRPRR